MKEGGFVSFAVDRLFDTVHKVWRCAIVFCYVKEYYTIFSTHI